MPSFSESISFAVFSYCAWEAIPTSEFSHELANWVTKIMMLPLLSLDIRGPSVFCLSLYTLPLSLERCPGWSSGQKKKVKATWSRSTPDSYSDQASLEWSLQTTYAWAKCLQKPEGAQMRCANPHPPDSWDIIINVCLSHWNLMWFVSQQ